MFLKTENPLIVLGAIIFGVLLGEWWKIEEEMRNPVHVDHSIRLMSTTLSG